MSGFNALLGDVLPDGRCRVCHISNRGRHVTSLGPGIYGLANGVGVDHASGSIPRGKQLLSQALAGRYPPVSDV